MPLEAVQRLHDIIGPDLEPRTFRNNAIPSETRLLTALSFFRSGSFQYVEGTVGGISQPSMSRILEKVCRCLIKHQSAFIKFPTTQSRLNQLKTEFFSLGQFPNVVGLIDGTHINIKAPNREEPAYVNRKGNHSINVQVVSGPNHEFQDLVIKWPGSTHDAFIWRHCGLKQRFERAEFGESWLLGKNLSTF
jgi:hypothetical protein